MTNGTATGTEKLVERIISAAKEEAAAAKAAAEESCLAIKAAGEKRGAALAAEDAQKRTAAAQSILERSRTNAELEARKSALLMRRALIQDAFDQAYAALCALSDKERADICRSMLLREADGGETIHASKNDIKQIALLLPTIEADMLKAGKKPLLLSPNAADIDCGFILSGDGYEKDCSFAALLRDTRANEETRVASILFAADA